MRSASVQRATYNVQRRLLAPQSSVARCPLHVARALLAAAAFAGFAPPAAAQTYYVVVSGVGGDPAYTTRFTAWGDTVVDAVRSRWGVPDSDIVYLGEHPEADSRMSGPATRQRVTAALQALAAKAGPEADVFLVLFGHGSDRGDGPRFNLVGPDITAAELSTLLAPIKARHLVVVDASSASGGVVAALSGPGRLVVTATKSGFERNATQFGGFFAAALANDGADTDKDGRVSVLEAFTYARREVARAYAKDNRLLTEHAVLDDNGDGTGSEAPQGGAGDGALAGAVFFGPAGGAAAVAATDPLLKALYARRDSLERHVAELRAAKSRMAPEAYEQQLEATLVDLATTSRAIREKEGKQP
jgi:hypothetical protein